MGYQPYASLDGNKGFCENAIFIYFQYIDHVRRFLATYLNWVRLPTDEEAKALAARDPDHGTIGAMDGVPHFRNVILSNEKITYSG